jgi:hypothetical protein
MVEAAVVEGEVEVSMVDTLAVDTTVGIMVGIGEDIMVVM